MRGGMYFMFTGKFEDKVLVILESILIILSTFILSSFNLTIANAICKITDIPYDLALTIMSAGFGNNIIILLSILEIILIVWFVEKLIPKFIDKLVWS